MLYSIGNFWILQAAICELLQQVLKHSLELALIALGVGLGSALLLSGGRAVFAHLTSLRS